MTLTDPGQITVVLPDGSHRTVPRGITVRDFATSIGPGLGRACLGARRGDAILDLRDALESDGPVEILTSRSPDGLMVIRHSAAHIMADAILRLWPGAKLAIGPAVADGFYYDIDLPEKLGPADLERIEEEMRRIIAEDRPFERRPVDRVEAIERFRRAGERYKVEILEDIPPGETVTVYRHGTFEDICRGPHVPSAGQVKAVKLLRIAGAYWRGDEKNPMLQRVYGTAFADAKALEEHLHRIEEARRRDHRRLGPELDLFSFHPWAPASPFFHPKGAVLYNELIGFVRELYRRRGFQEVITPQIFDVALFRTSGHYDNYRDNMFFIRDGEQEFGVKPMNCPSHALIFATRTRSYRDLPLRIADFGRLHRFERSGVVSGLTRVRTFAQDDAHIFCMPDQVESEIAANIEMMFTTYRQFGFENITVNLSTRPPARMGDDALWDRAEEALEAALRRNDVAFRLNPGDGAFYGPKIDFSVEDALGRSWQTATIQLDFQLPERFDLSYSAPDGSLARPVMVHRAMLGSLERFIGILIEHCAGAFPFWLAPVQVVVLPITDAHADRAREVLLALTAAGWRAEGDFSNRKTGAKIREAQVGQVPYILVIGDREVADGTVSVRERREGDLGAMSLEAILERFRQRVADRR